MILIFRHDSLVLVPFQRSPPNQEACTSNVLCQNSTKASALVGWNGTRPPMRSHRALLPNRKGPAHPPQWSYLHTGILPRLNSFVCHSYENCRGVGVFFPFWNGAEEGARTAKRASLARVCRWLLVQRQRRGHRVVHLFVQNIPLLERILGSVDG